MLNIVGPPMVGATELKSQTDKLQAKDFKGSGATDSNFNKALQDKINLRSPKEAKESPKQEARAKDSNDSKETRDEKAPAKDAKPERKVSTNDGKEKRAANRQQAIKEFMDSFESEFEIPPTRLVEAMAELDDSQLKQSPEVTANAVIDQLNLDDDQAEKAAAMYAGLLAQLQQMPQQQQPKAMTEMSVGAGMSAQSMQMRVAAAQDKQTQLGAAAENVNKKFWMKQEPAAKMSTMPDLNGDLASRMMMDDSSLQEAPPVEMPAQQAPESMNQQSLLDKLPPHLQGQMKETMSPALLAALAAKQAAAAAEKAEGVAAEDSSSDLTNEFTKALEAPQMDKPQQADMMNKAVAPKTSPESFFQQQGQGQSAMQDSANEYMQQGMAHGKEAAKEKLTAKAADFKAEMTGLEGLQAQPLKGEALKFDPAMAAMAPKPAPATEAQNEANVKQLMNQAQYLIKQGGGEVKVQMTPEGMGTIHLKVMLQDGKVNLQMQADSQEAKKSIESSLVDLKNSLAAHKLSVENVKVDVVNNTSADTATQNQNNTNGQDQRNQARQFWNNFNDSFGNQGRRESFTEMQGVRGYGGKRRDPLQPIDTASVKAAPRAIEGKGSGLNLVA
ncbi:flagellar hook-length control protein FliK [Bdellovibrio sp. SKB1291214]|uniref:flagellar hook-length control protein FliK n=1 Tax=Bdellovibrio sp. SKB1291214 TaxID=1732569 RepID=UPI00223FF263|nr:flagellar hook-length control protein FliK [Bdellovibrio sp. SKB1291214]UYL08746.1 flagellar hook-length control protein FliK [Bdellovibrio sp. SKB1291214]